MRGNQLCSGILHMLFYLVLVISLWGSHYGCSIDRKLGIWAVKGLELDRDSNLHTVSTDLCYLLWESKYLPDSVTSDVPSLEKTIIGKKRKKNKRKEEFYISVTGNWTSSADIFYWIPTVMTIDKYLKCHRIIIITNIPENCN